ncbi:MAG: NUDIX domain-containing protein [Patescibacteria group bacterium]|jgi:mutator protein MutT
MAEQKEEIITQKAVIIKSTQLLILKRSQTEKAFAGLWDFAGGKAEIGENDEQSLIREVKEETALDIKPKEILGTYFGELNKKSVKFIIFMAEVIAGEVRINFEHDDYKWADVDEIKKLPAMSYMADFLADFKINN